MLNAINYRKWGFEWGKGKILIIKKVFSFCRRRRLRKKIITTTSWKARVFVHWWETSRRILWKNHHHDELQTYGKFKLKLYQLLPSSISQEIMQKFLSFLLIILFSFCKFKLFPNESTFLFAVKIKNKI